MRQNLINGPDTNVGVASSLWNPHFLQKASFVKSQVIQV